MPAPAATLSCMNATGFVPVILSGGAGTRLWPLSREAAPKPFVALPDGGTLLGKTAACARRLRGVGPLLTAAIAGQLIGAVMLDHYGLIGLARQPLSVEKIAGVVLVLVGAALVRRG